MGGEIIFKHYQNEHYKVRFNQKTGFFIRCEDDGFPEPKWSRHGPELIDLSITSFCQRACSFCYRQAGDASYRHMCLPDVADVVRQAVECGTLQIALGGGNPNQHPFFPDILRMIYENGIVPSYTTNGDGLTDDILKASSNYCGAVAISVYPPINESFYDKLIRRFRAYGIKINVHAIIRDDYLELWTRWLENPPEFLRLVNAIVFLNYKPVGKEGVSLLPKSLDKVGHFFRAVENCKAIKVGFDSCSISGIVKWMNVPEVLVEPCEAARFSAFISEDMKMYPCSFMIDKGLCGDLRKESMLDIWQNNESFQQFRIDALPAGCNSCKHAGICKGGCRIFKTINFC